MKKLILGVMCVGLGVGTLAGCTSSTMPAPNDPSTAIHEEPLMKSGATPAQTGPAVATNKTGLTESVAAAK